MSNVLRFAALLIIPTLLNGRGMTWLQAAAITAGILLAGILINAFRQPARRVVVTVADVTPGLDWTTAPGRGIEE